MGNEPVINRLHALVCGRVQGVWFRASTQEKARSLGLLGWVMNLPDGRVELVAEGPRSVLDEFLVFLAEGPPLARVDGVEVSWQDPQGGFSGFALRR